MFFPGEASRLTFAGSAAAIQCHATLLRGHPSASSPDVRTEEFRHKYKCNVHLISDVN